MNYEGLKSGKENKSVAIIAYSYYFKLKHFLIAFQQYWINMGLFDLNFSRIIFEIIKVERINFKRIDLYLRMMLKKWV